MVTRNHWWPGITSNVGKYVDGCDISKNKEQNGETSGEAEVE